MQPAPLPAAAGQIFLVGRLLKRTCPPLDRVRALDCLLLRRGKQATATTDKSIRSMEGSGQSIESIMARPSIKQIETGDQRSPCFSGWFGCAGVMV